MVVIELQGATLTLKLDRICLPIQEASTRKTPVFLDNSLSALNVSHCDIFLEQMLEDPNRRFAILEVPLTCENPDHQIYIPCS